MSSLGTGSEKTDGATRRCNRKASRIPRPCLCVMSSTAATVVCQPEHVVQRSRRHLGAQCIKSHPFHRWLVLGGTVGRPRGEQGTLAEGGGNAGWSRAAPRGPARRVHAAHTGEEKPSNCWLARNHRPNRNRKRRQRRTAGNVFGFVQSGLGEHQKPSGDALNRWRLKLHGHGRGLSVQSTVCIWSSTSLFLAFVWPPRHWARERDRSFQGQVIDNAVL
jgi:hypothetical protein